MKNGHGPRSKRPSLPDEFEQVQTLRRKLGEAADGCLHSVVICAGFIIAIDAARGVGMDKDATVAALATLWDIDERFSAVPSGPKEETDEPQ